nr:hypothetical protein [Mycoplasma haemofelis]
MVIPHQEINSNKNSRLLRDLIPKPREIRVNKKERKAQANLMLLRLLLEIVIRMLGQGKKKEILLMREAVLMIKEQNNQKGMVLLVVHKMEMRVLQELLLMEPQMQSMIML